MRFHQFNEVLEHILELNTNFIAIQLISDEDGKQCMSG
jgi:hypothetical protein